MARAGNHTPRPCYCAKPLVTRSKLATEVLFPAEFIYALRSAITWRMNLIRFYRLVIFPLACAFLLSITSFGQAQLYPQSTYQDMHWRMIGPFRGGRTRAVA